MKRNSLLAVSTLAAASILMLSTSVASATEQNDGTDERQAAADFPVDVEPVADHLVIDGERVEVAVMPSFPSTGYVEILNGQTVEYGEIVDGGTIVTDRTADEPVSPQAVTSCNWTSWIAPATGNYVPTLQGCSFIGLNSSVQAGYEVVIGSASLGGACTMAKGFHLVPISGGGYQYSAFWTALGCRPGGSTYGGVVPWGNVAANKQMLVKATTALVGANGQFR